MPFYKELGNQGVKATDTPVIAFSVGEEELAGVDTKPLVGHLAAWSYFQSVDTPENKAFIAKWRAYTKNPKRVTNRPHGIGLYPCFICGCRRYSRLARRMSKPFGRR